MAMAKKKLRVKEEKLSGDDLEVNTAFSVGNSKLEELEDADAHAVKKYLCSVLSHLTNTITVKQVDTGFVVTFKPQLAEDVVASVTKAWA